MHFFLHTARRLTRTTCWLVLVSFLGSLMAPALHAAETRSIKATLSTETGTTTMTAEGGTGTPEQTAQNEAASQNQTTSGDVKASTNATASDQLYERIPKSDRTELNRTLATIVGGVLLGAFGFSFGWIGLALGGILGAGLGYIIAKQVFPSRRSVSNNPRSLSDPYYDSRYGRGSARTPNYGYTAPEGTSVRDLEQAYFDALTQYRQKLRGNDLQATNDARATYKEAYEKLIRAKAIANQGY
jgi:hypothetical protein